MSQLTLKNGQTWERQGEDRWVLVAELTPVFAGARDEFGRRLASVRETRPASAHTATDRQIERFVETLGVRS